MADAYEDMDALESPVEKNAKKGKKTKKIEATPKTKKPKKVKIDKKTGLPAEKRENNRRGKIFLPIIILVIVIFAVAAFVFMSIRFDAFGTRTLFINWACSLDPEYGDFFDRVSDLEYQIDDIETREAELEYQWELLAEEREELYNLEQDINSEIDGRTPLWRSPMSAQDIADMENLAKIYGAMTAENAADIMSQLYSADEMASILYYMPTKKSAAVLSAMEHDLAAAVTEVLLSK